MSTKKLTDLSDEAVQKQLKQLEDYFGEPVLPMSQYCAAFRTWADCIVKNNKDPKLTQKGWNNHGSEYAEMVMRIMIDIDKSSLLGRLLYGKEKLRTKMCPEHKGHWNGQAMMMGNCPHQCDGTGWLREE